MRGTLSAGPQPSLARAGRAGGSALLLSETARTQHSGIVRAWYRADRILRRDAGVLGSVSGNRTCSWHAGPHAWARSSSCRAPAPPGRPSVCPPPPARRGAAAPPAGPHGAPKCGRSGPPRRPPGGTGPAASGGRRGKPAPLPGDPLPVGEGRPRQGLMPPYLSRPDRGGRGRRRRGSGAVTAAAPAPLPNR